MTGRADYPKVLQKKLRYVDKRRTERCSQQRRCYDSGRKKIYKITYLEELYIAYLGCGGGRECNVSQTFFL